MVIANNYPLEPMAKTYEGPGATLGRIVHYRRGRGGEALAALVTESYGDGHTVNLTVQPPGADLFHVTSARHIRPTENGGWFWPPRI